MLYLILSSVWMLVNSQSCPESFECPKETCSKPVGTAVSDSTTCLFSCPGINIFIYILYICI